MKCALKAFLFSQAKKKDIQTNNAAISQSYKLIPSPGSLKYIGLGLETIQKPEGCFQILHFFSINTMHISYNVQCICVNTDLPSIYGSLGKMFLPSADNLEASRSCLVLVAGASVGTYGRLDVYCLLSRC